MFSGWIKDFEDPIFSYLTNLVETITNTSLKTAEDWQASLFYFTFELNISYLFKKILIQIANYGIGGQYDPHFDFAMVRLFRLSIHLLKEILTIFNSRAPTRLRTH